VVLNLVRNSTNFVEHGFVRMRAAVVDGQARLYIEDSGPGIRPDKRTELFSKYQVSLDRLNQGTGIGLNLSKKLMESMDGDIWLDETYNSGVEGCPGACFVVDLDSSPLDLETAFPDESEMAPTRTRSPPPWATSSLVRNKSQKQLQREDSSDRNKQEMPFQRDFCPVPPTGASAIPPSPPAIPLSPPSPPPQLPNDNAPLSVVAEDVKITSPGPSENNNAAAISEQQLPANLSVLFVDDDAILRKLFVRACKKVGPSWTFKEAASGHAALRLCESESFDLIFLDQYMPSVDNPLLGTETCQLMRAQEGMQCTVICGLSANNMEEGFMHSGADDFILKPMPCKPANLKELLLRLLQDKQPVSTRDT